MSSATERNGLVRVETVRQAFSTVRPVAPIVSCSMRGDSLIWISSDLAERSKKANAIPMM